MTNNGDLVLEILEEVLSYWHELAIKDKRGDTNLSKHGLDG